MIPSAIRTRAPLWFHTHDGRSFPRIGEAFDELTWRQRYGNRAALVADRYHVATAQEVPRG